jgi:DNA-binding transcriptional LysR family regulator
VDDVIQLEDLRIFVATVDARNFTAAANRLQLSKQFVSRRVMALEANLGVRLLVRNTRKLAVTDLGLEFYERATRILGEVADAEQAMSSQRSDPRGLLRISAPMSFGTTHLSPLVADFMRANADVRIDMELSDRVVDVIGEGFDMALRIGTLPDSTLIAQKLTEFRRVAQPTLRRGATPSCHAGGYRAPSVPAVWAGRPYGLGIRGRRRETDIRGAWSAAGEQRRSDPRCRHGRARHRVAAGIHHLFGTRKRQTDRGARHVRVAAAHAVCGVSATSRELDHDSRVCPLSAPTVRSGTRHLSYAEHRVASKISLGQLSRRDYRARWDIEIFFNVSFFVGSKGPP